MKNLIILFIISLLFLSACREKNKKLVNNSYTLSGVILKNCEGEPLANAEVALMLESNEFLGVEWGGSTTRFKTDANGRFAVSYQAVSNSNISLVLFNQVGYNRILSAIPQNQNVDLGKVFVSKRYKFILKAKLVNQYTEHDTLFYYYGNSTKLYSIPGPFANILDTLVVSSTSIIYQPIKKETMRIVWNVNSKNMNFLKDSDVLGYCDHYNTVEIDL